MSVLDDLVGMVSGVGADGIHLSAVAPDRCLWSCQWVFDVDRHSKLTPAYLGPDDILPLESASVAQLLAELGDVAAWTVYKDRVETGRMASEAASWAVLLAGQASFADMVRDWLRGVREYALPGRSYRFPGEDVQGAAARPGWE